MLPDIDRDSKTLGTPLEYLETGHVQPLLIVRSPPVHFDAFDTSTNGEPGTGPDGKVDPTEVWDVNNCFTDYLATGRTTPATRPRRTGRARPSRQRCMAR